MSAAREPAASNSALDGDITERSMPAMRRTPTCTRSTKRRTPISRAGPHLLAKRAHTLDAARTTGRSARLSLYVGRRFDGAGGVSPLASHTTADLLASHRLNAHFELFARVENLFDARYEPVAGYGAPGRAVYAGIRVRD